MTDAGTGKARAAAGPSWEPPAQTPTRLVLVRHGSTVHSGQRRLSGRNDLPLDDAGRAQAEALAGRLPGRGPFAAVVSSPLRRARETAEVIAAAAGLAVSTDDDLVEADFGEWEGLTGDEARERDPERFAAWLADPCTAPPGGEALAEATRRARRARDRIVAAHPGTNVLAVTHVTPIKALVRLALGAPEDAMFRMHLDTGTASVIDYFADGNASVRLFNC